MYLHISMILSTLGLDPHGFALEFSPKGLILMEIFHFLIFPWSSHSLSDVGLYSHPNNSPLEWSPFIRLVYSSIDQAICFNALGTRLIWSTLSNALAAHALYGPPPSGLKSIHGFNRHRTHRSSFDTSSLTRDFGSDTSLLWKTT